MFNNIGGKLKGLAYFITILGMICSVISAIVLWMANSRYNPTVFAGFLCLVLGCLFSWIGGWATYGLGEAAEKATEANNRITELENQISRMNAIPSSNTSGNHSSAPSSSSSYKPNLLDGAYGSGKSGQTCRYCGAHNSSTAQFCKDCGKDF